MEKKRLLSKFSIIYNSTLGNIGEIPFDSINFIELGKADTSRVIKIGIKSSFNLNSKLNDFRQRVSRLYKKKTGAEILIFPQDIDMDIDELYKILEIKLQSFI